MPSCSTIHPLDLKEDPGPEGFSGLERWPFTVARKWASRPWEPPCLRGRRSLLAHLGPLRLSVRAVPTQSCGWHGAANRICSTAANMDLGVIPGWLFRPPIRRTT